MRLKYLYIISPMLALLAACSGEDKKAGADKAQADEIPTVKVERVETQNVEQVFNYTASTEADKVNNISSSMPLRIESILVDEGQNVAAGQQVVVLDDVNTTSYELNVSTAQAQLRNVQLEYDRAKELLAIGGGTRQQVDQLALQLETARNNVASAAAPWTTPARTAC